MGQVSMDGKRIDDLFYGQFRLVATPLYPEGRSFQDNYELAYPDEESIFSAEPYTVVMGRKILFEASAVQGLHQSWNRRDTKFQCWQYTGEDEFDVNTFRGYE